MEDQQPAAGDLTADAAVQALKDDITEVAEADTNQSTERDENADAATVSADIASGVQSGQTSGQGC